MEQDQDTLFIPPFYCLKVEIGNCFLFFLEKQSEYC